MARKKRPARKGLPPDRPCGNTLTGGTLVQSLTFSKEKHRRRTKPWSKKSASGWARDHGYVHSAVDEKPGTFRIRQFDPGHCEYRTVPFGTSGISGVIETPRRRAPAQVQEAVDVELLRRHRRKHAA